MPEKTTTKPQRSTGKKRRGRLLPAMYERAAFLDTMPHTAEATALLADVLSLWTRLMLTAGPTLAGDIYRALSKAWQVSREECRHGDERDELAVQFHHALIDRVHELRGEECASCSGRGRGDTLGTFTSELHAEVGRRSAYAVAECRDGGVSAEGEEGECADRTELERSVRDGVNEMAAENGPAYARRFMQTTLEMIEQGGFTEDAIYQVATQEAEAAARGLKVPERLAGRVIDMACWLSTHPRPVRNLLFAEK